MEIDLVFKIAAIGIIVAVLNQLLIRSGREDQAMMTTLAGLVVVLSILVKQISTPVCYHQGAVFAVSSAWVTLGLVAVLAAMHALLQKELPAYALLLSLGAIVLLLVRLGGTFRSVLEGVALLGQQTDKQAFQCLLRSTGILLLADYTRTLCKESGAEALGWCAGLAGRCLVLAAVFPLLEEVCQRIWGLAG